MNLCKLETVHMTPRRLSDLFALFFDPRVPILFVLGSIVLAIVGNGVYDLLLGWFGSTPQTIGAVTVGSVLVMGFIILGFRALVHARAVRFETLVPEEQEARPHPNLVLFVSAGDLEHGNEQHALARHLKEQTLRHCWLIASPEAARNARELKYRLEDQNVEAHIIPVEDAYHARKAFDAVHEALQQMKGLRVTGPLMVDITAGARPMAVGAVLACWRHRLPMEYVLGKYVDGKLDKRVPPQVMTIDVQDQE
jgi:hypothetical protein